MCASLGPRPADAVKDEAIEYWFQRLMTLSLDEHTHREALRWPDSSVRRLAREIVRALVDARRTRDREIARMARDSGVNELVRFAAMLEADALP